MTPIEEKAQAYAENIGREYEYDGREEIAKQAYLQGAKDFLSLSMCERLTEEGKVEIRGFYNGETFGELDFIELVSCRRILASLFGSEFFKKGDCDE